MDKLLLLIGVTFLLGLGIFLDVTAKEDVIPSWIKNPTGWWTDGKIDDSSFVEGIQWLVKEGIIEIPQTPKGGINGTDKIPVWIKNTAKSWSEDQLGDTEFLNALGFLANEGILKIQSDDMTKELTKSKHDPSDDDMQLKTPAIVKANNKFSLSFYNKVAPDTDENIFFSPFSISTVFSVIYEGTEGKTSEEISDVFGFVIDHSKRRLAFKNLLEDSTQNSNYTLQMANALWIAQEFQPSSSYVDVAKTYYESEVNNVDFVSDEGVHAINEWVKEKTENKIQKLLDLGSTNENTRLVVTNAIYFNGTWLNQFPKESTSDADFKISSEEVVKTKMMYLPPTILNYTENEHLEVLELPYKGDKISMLVFLPKKVDGINELEESLTMTNISEWQNDLSEKNIAVFLPKFTLDTNYDLKKTLQQMGVKTAFDPKEADFGKITNSEDLYIEFAIHKAFVDVNEVGTEAAAATGIGVSVTSAPPTFNADHPFIFIIQDNETRNILFMGRVMNPSS